MKLKSWKEDSKNRKDFRQSKTEPEIPKLKNKPKKKQYTLYGVIGDTSSYGILILKGNKRWQLGKFSKLDAAKQSLEYHAKNQFWSKLYKQLIILDKDDNVVVEYNLKFY